MKQFTLNNEIERISIEEKQCRPEIKFILCVQTTSDFDLVDARFKTFGQSSCCEDMWIQYLDHIIRPQPVSVFWDIFSDSQNDFRSMDGGEDPSLGDVLDGVAEAVITNKVLQILTICQLST